MIDVLIHSPYPLQDSQGNTTSAERLEQMLSEFQFSIKVESEWYGGEEARCLVALNARRSAGAIEEYRDACPEGGVVIVLTGTDINHAEMADESSRTREAMAVADVLVLLHEESYVQIPKELHKKCVVIYPSVQLPEGLIAEGKKEEKTKPLQVIMVGNVRREKNVSLVISALERLPENSPLIIRVYGNAEGYYAEEMKRAEARFKSFQWKGKVSHEEALIQINKADVLLNSSTEEGGSNAICEAVSLGVPVLASDISGNVGMLGREYNGYFECGDADDLARYLALLSRDSSVLEQLKQQIGARAGLFRYKQESEAWKKLFDELEIVSECSNGREKS